MSSSHFQTGLFIYTALPCEAKPLIEHYRLKKDISIHAFNVFRQDVITLTVTGIGKSAMAAGVAYTQALFADETIPVMLNVGIAGHRDAKLGTLFLADKITDGDSGRSFYPPLAITLPCPTLPLETYAKPQSQYPEFAMCDMEGAAFYETATRFSTGELCHCLKVVSDNAETPTSQIDASKATALIATNLATIAKVIEDLCQLRGLIGDDPNNPILFEAINQRYRLTVNEQQQLKKLLGRLAAMNAENRFDISANPAKNAKDLLLSLTRLLDDLPYQL